MSKNRLTSLLPILLAIALLFAVCSCTIFADGEDNTTSVESEETTSVDEETTSVESSEASETSEASDASDDSSAASSAVTSSASSEEASVASSEEQSQPNNTKTSSNIPWKLIITVGVIVVIAAVLFILAKTNSKLGQKIAKFFKDYKSELKKISWMPRKELIKSTLVVLVVLVISGVAIGLLDFAFSSLLKLLSSIGS